jgi:hypothetical protein
MSKIDFPLGVELPLRGGGVAVLCEFFDGRWWGRSHQRCQDAIWFAGSWAPDGKDSISNTGRMDILPPKRKAWVVWDSNGPQLFTDKTKAVEAKVWREICAHGQRTYAMQEIAEP